MAVNHMIMYWPDSLEYGVSWHHDILPTFLAVRDYRKKSNGTVLYGPKKYEGINHGRFYKGDISTSGMYAVCVALHLGYEKIILAGIPFDDSGYFYTPFTTRHGKTYNYVYPATKQWEDVKKMAGDRVRAISGNLTECFGEFTEEWLGQYG
jgi:hypothetical protein